MRFHIITVKAVCYMRLKDLREDRDIKQKDIAEYLHIKQNTYSQYENGQRQLPVDILIKLSEYYNVSTDYILGISKER
ncbi:MAG: helix-turn-helix transcriptional regulator [Oscillospiraceae bacterium]|nr:helix-turn-helix transcriptional regulator [Oscillospiraceae bacterium]